ncbi:helix-turn-helix domain-containing protein [Victivallis vadensis]|uniref:helix-turn-helix domain-containing protein n=1 Tax=Victivallis vadensis TaxID=172901 RepID=UPI003AF48351
MENSQKNRIRELAQQLESCPPVQFPPPDGLPGEPGGILIQRRCAEVKINPGGSDRLKLFHRRFVLTAALEREGLVCVNDLTFPVAPDYASLVYPFQYHHYVVDQSDFFWMVVTFELERMFYPETLYHCSVKMTPVTYGLLARMVELYLEYGGGDPRVRRYLNCLLAELDAEPCRIDAGTHAPASDRRVRLFEEVNGYICLHLAEPGLSVEEIARKHGVSKSYLYSVFEKMVGCHPAEYIRQLRLQQAYRLLKSGRWLLSEVAGQCGFSSLSVFSRCFRNVTGVPPSEYLRSERGRTSAE